MNLKKFYEFPGRKNFYFLLNMIKSKENLRILDVGCGNGENTIKIKKVCPNSDVVGIDFTNEFLKNAKNLGIKIKITNIEKDRFPFTDNYFDIIVSNMVIEHIDDLDHFISEQKRILKEDGRLFISTNNASSWHNIISLIFGWQPFDLTNITPYSGIGNPFSIHKDKKPEENIKAMCHKRIYTVRYLKDFLKIKGFDKIKYFGEGYFPLPSFFGKIDKTHSQFFIIKGVKR